MVGVVLPVGLCVSLAALPFAVVGGGVVRWRQRRRQALQLRNLNQRVIRLPSLPDEFLDLDLRSSEFGRHLGERRASLVSVRRSSDELLATRRRAASVELLADRVASREETPRDIFSGTVTTSGEEEDEDKQGAMVAGNKHHTSLNDGLSDGGDGAKAVLYTSADVYGCELGSLSVCRAELERLKQLQVRRQLEIDRIKDLKDQHDCAG